MNWSWAFAIVGVFAVVVWGVVQLVKIAAANMKDAPRSDRHIRFEPTPNPTYTWEQKLLRGEDEEDKS